MLLYVPMLGYGQHWRQGRHTVARGRHHPARRAGHRVGLYSCAVQWRP